MEPSAALSVRLAGERKVAKRKREATEEAKQAAGDGAQTQTCTMHSSEKAMATSNVRLGLRPAAAADADDDIVLGKFIRFIHWFLATSGATSFTRFIYLWRPAQRRVLRVFYVVTYLLGSRAWAWTKVEPIR